MAWLGARLGSRLKQWIFQRAVNRLLSRLAKEGHMNFLKGHKTVLFNVLTIAAAVFATDEVRAIVSPQVLLVLVGAVNVLLRFVTTSRVFQK